MAVIYIKLWGNGQICTQSGGQLRSAPPLPPSGPSNSERAEVGELASWTGPEKAHRAKKMPVAGALASGAGERGQLSGSGALEGRVY